MTPNRLIDREKPLASLKGNQARNCYSDWLGLVYSDDNNNVRPAKNVQFFLNDRIHSLESLQFILHCYYYDMEPGQAKARCWYESEMPLLNIPDEYREQFVYFVSILVSTASEVSKELVKHVKAAWFSRPKDAKGDTGMVNQSFWKDTEAGFYQQLQILASQPASTRFMPAEVAKQWLNTIRRTAFELFDQWALEGDAEDMNMKRIIQARRDLGLKLKSIKSLKDLEQIASTQATEVA